MEICSTASRRVTYSLLSEKYANSEPPCTKASRVLVRRIFTKLDGTAKGGICVAIAQELGVPVKYVGLGEGIDDLEPFDAKEYLKNFI